MPFLLLLLLAIACWPDSWPRPFWAEGTGLSGWSFALLTWSAMALMVAAVLGASAQARDACEQGWGPANIWEGQEGRVGQVGRVGSTVSRNGTGTLAVVIAAIVARRGGSAWDGSGVRSPA